MKTCKLLCVMLVAVLLCSALFACGFRPQNDLTQPVDSTQPDPMETESTETDPVVTDPVETDPVETDPVVTEPVETEPVETEPVETEPVETEPAETEPAETEPVETTKPSTPSGGGGGGGGGSSHSHVWTETVVAPTCVSAGYTLRACHCGTSIKVDIVLADSNAHDWEITNPEVGATCTENGVFIAKCKLCEKETQQAEEAKGHSWDPEESCTEDKVCTVCQTVLPAAGHIFPETPESVTEATCKAGVAVKAIASDLTPSKSLFTT